MTSYDAAFVGLSAHGASSYRTATRSIPVEFMLATMVALWEKCTQSLRFKLNSIRQDRYFDVESLWKALSTHLDTKDQTASSEKLLCELLPLMAFWDPATMTRHLDPTLRFLTRIKPSLCELMLSREGSCVRCTLLTEFAASPHIIALGKIVQGLATAVLPMLSRIIQYLLEAVEQASK